MTKQVTALLILQDAAAGRIALDAPLARYLPLAPVWAGSVTIEHLLRHTSGLRERELPKQLPTDFPYRAATAPRQWARPAALAAAVCADAPVSVPGTQFAYGDCDYFWLGAVLEAVHGRTWDTLARERIAKPLGLRSWRAAAPGRDRTARGYVAGDKLEPPVGLWAYSSAAGLTGTLTDLARFEQALVSGSLLAPEWMARMFDGRAENQSHAMGSWAYDLPAANGAAVRFIERQGWVGGVKLAAVSVPAESLVLVLVSNDPDTVLDGPWNPRGLVSRLLEAARID